MDWFEKLEGLKEFIGLLVAVIALITAIVSRKQVVFHITEDANNTPPTTGPRVAASSSANEEKGARERRPFGPGAFIFVFLLGAVITVLGAYLIRPTLLGPNHALPLALLAFGGFASASGIGWYIPYICLGAESVALDDELTSIPKGSPAEALHEIRTNTAMIIWCCSVAIIWIIEIWMFVNNRTYSNVMWVLIAFLLLGAAASVIVVLPLWWIRYRWRRWRSSAS